LIASPEKILVINVTRIGDTLLLTPALRAIASFWPMAGIDVLGHRRRVEVLASLPFLRRVGGISKHTAWCRGWFITEPYDLTFVYGFDTALVRYALRVSKHVVAFRQKDSDLNRQLGTVVQPPGFQSDHAVRQAFALPAAVGLKLDGGRLMYLVTAAERYWAAEQIAKDWPRDAKPLVGLQIASFPTKGYRDWPAEHFLALCRRILHRWPKAHFAIFGGRQERKRVDLIKSGLGSAATAYAGRLSLRQTGALMSRLDLYIGVDTGPTHLMSSFDIPLVGLYHGSSRSELIGPLDHPCLYAIDGPPADHEDSNEASMANISVDLVFEKVCSALNRLEN
jgi:heptosyltransferase-3